MLAVTRHKVMLRDANAEWRCTSDLRVVLKKKADPGTLGSTTTLPGTHPLHGPVDILLLQAGAFRGLSRATDDLAELGHFGHLDHFQEYDIAVAEYDELSSGLQPQPISDFLRNGDLAL